MKFCNEIIVICSRKSHHLMSILGSFDKPLKKDEMFTTNKFPSITYELTIKAVIFSLSCQYVFLWMTMLTFGFFKRNTSLED